MGTRHPATGFQSESRPLFALAFRITARKPSHNPAIDRNVIAANAMNNGVLQLLNLKNLSRTVGVKANSAHLRIQHR
jgi:hypothetical protein